MTDHEAIPKHVEVGGHIFEELAFQHLAKKYNISKEDILLLAKNKNNINNSIPISILKTPELSSLEAIVKFLRENKNISYKLIGALLNRNPKTLAVTYNIARRKKSPIFSRDIDNDLIRIPFSSFNNNLSILESICIYLKSQGHSYADISRMINKDQRTVWTVCKRANVKLEKKNLKEKNNGR